MTLNNEQNKKYISLFSDIISIEEFELVRYKNGLWGVHDLQGANLGGIESDSFDTIAQILDRMEIYHIDYFEESILNYFEIENFENYIDLVEQCRNKIKNDKNGEFSDYSETELNYLEFIGNAPNIDICNTPLEQIKDLLDYEQLDYDLETEE